MKNIALILPALLLSACSQPPAPVARPDSAQPVKEKAVQVMLTLKVKVVYQPLEGGFYGLVDAQGRRWLPLALDQQYQRNGLQMTVTGQPAAGTMTAQQWGTPFRITAVTAVDDSAVQDPGVKY
ncbi:hypothetical protein [Gallaecimonas sp. GXIMD1310]|uniref:hypothetical protein n=1 Tax=Gallaecimonas sp. GXIMD1310 TaxID=3131926 RepID=UPI003255AA18